MLSFSRKLRCVQWKFYFCEKEKVRKSFTKHGKMKNQTKCKNDENFPSQTLWKTFSLPAGKTLQNKKNDNKNWNEKII